VLALESIKDAQAAEISALKSRIKKLEKKCKPSISHHRAWLKSMKRLSMKKRFGKKESKAAGMDEEEVPEESESTKVEVKQEGRKENIKKRSGRRLKMKATKKSKRQKTDSDLEEEEQLRASLKIVPDEEEEIDYEVLGTRVFRANGSSRYIKTFTEMALEDEMKRSSSSTSTSQNLAFLSSKNTSSTNEVSTANGDFRVSTAGGISQVSSTLCAHDVACSFFAQPTTSPQLENKDFQQIDEDNLEELDLIWQVAMLTVKALMAQNGLGGYDWSNDFEIELVNYALMAISSSSSSSSSENEISLSVFYVRSSDEESTPANDRYSKEDGYHVVPPPITGNFLTPRDDISFAGKTNEANTQKPKTVYESVNRDKVIIEDWNSDDEDDVSEVQTVSTVKTNETQTSRKPKLKTMVNTGPRVDKPVWDNTKRVNHQKISKYPHVRKNFSPSGVLIRTGLITPIKQNEERVVHTVSTARPLVLLGHSRDLNARIMQRWIVVAFLSHYDLEQKLIFQTMKITMEDLWLLEVIPKEVHKDSYVARFIRKDYKGPIWIYILPFHETSLLVPRIPVEDVAPAAHEKPSESSPKDNDVQDSEDDKEGQHQMTEDEQVLHDDLKKMIAQEVLSKALDMMPQDKLLKKKRGILHLKRGQLVYPWSLDDDGCGLHEAGFNNMDNTPCNFKQEERSKRDKDPAFDDLDDIVDDAMDYIDSEDAQDEGRTSSVVLEEKESIQKGVSTKVEVSRKYLRKKDESDAESEGVDEAERKFDQLAKDEEIARKVQEDWEAEEEMKKLAEEEATKAALL
ncbi:hypothetical protein Tco_0401078, partial [Tanacetum coccineum]